MAARFLLRVEGMVCGRCTAKVERVLLSVDGVEFARADLVSKQVDVLAAPQVTRHHLVDALEGCGHGVSDITGPLDPEEAPPSATPVGGGGVPPGATSGEDPTPRDPRTTALHVPGMVCAHCKAKVERVLRLLTGVEEVSPPPLPVAAARSTSPGTESSVQVDRGAREEPVPCSGKWRPSKVPSRQPWR